MQPITNEMSIKVQEGVNELHTQYRMRDVMRRIQGERISHDRITLDQLEVILLITSGDEDFASEMFREICDTYELLKPFFAKDRHAINNAYMRYVYEVGKEQIIVDKLDMQS